MGKLPTLRPSLLDYLVEQKRGAARQARTSAFARSGTSVTAEGAQSLDGTLTVTPDTGFVSIDGSLGVHGTAAFDGTTTIGGDLVVAGTLSLPNGIVGGAALADDSIDGKTITGATIRTAESGIRWEMASTVTNALIGYTGSSIETLPGGMQVSASIIGPDHVAINLQSPNTDPTFAAQAAFLSLGMYADLSTTALLVANTINLSGRVVLPVLPAVYANNAAAITGGLTVGTFYRNGADPDHLCIVH